jgi:hypothetical protein
MATRIRQNQPLIFAQPLEERVDKAAQRQLAGTGPASREEGRQRQSGDEDATGWWWNDAGAWTYHGSEDPPA